MEKLHDDDPAEKAVGRISEKMPAAVMRLNKAKTKLPFFRKLLYNVNYLI